MYRFSFDLQSFIASSDKQLSAVSSCHACGVWDWKCMDGFYYHVTPTAFGKRFAWMGSIILSRLQRLERISMDGFYHPVTPTAFGKGIAWCVLSSCHAYSVWRGLEWMGSIILSRLRRSVRICMVCSIILSHLRRWDFPFLRKLPKGLGH